MMRLLAKPTPAQIDRFLCDEAAAPLTYSEVGQTLGDPPSGFDVHASRVLLGRGDRVFHAACDALRHWEMFPRPWTEVQPASASIAEGTVVAVLVRACGCWWMNSCRIVYSVDESEAPRRLGFAYGTLPGHAECGEEQFLIEWDQDDHVWYGISAFSRPRYWLARLGYPVVRRLQRQFVADSMAQMQQAVETVSGHRIASESCDRDSIPMLS